MGWAGGEVGGGGEGRGLASLGRAFFGRASLGRASPSHLRDPWHVADDEGTAREAMDQGSALQQPKEEHVELGVEDVDHGVDNCELGGRVMPTGPAWPLAPLVSLDPKCDRVTCGGHRSAPPPQLTQRAVDSARVLIQACGRGNARDERAAGDNGDRDIDQAHDPGDGRLEHVKPPIPERGRVNVSVREWGRAQPPVGDRVRTRRDRVGGGAGGGGGGGGGGLGEEVRGGRASLSLALRTTPCPEAPSPTPSRWPRRSGRSP